MSWSFTVNGSVQEFEISAELSERFTAVNEEYRSDMVLALVMAKALELKTATLTGFRTPSPYGGPDTIAISVMGTTEGVEWFDHVKKNLNAGPDAESS